MSILGDIAKNRLSLKISQDILLKTKDGLLQTEKLLLKTKMVY